VAVCLWSLKGRLPRPLYAISAPVKFQQQGLMTFTCHPSTASEGSCFWINWTLRQWQAPFKGINMTSFRPCEAQTNLPAGKQTDPIQPLIQAVWRNLSFPQAKKSRLRRRLIQSEINQ
jgi:hypothetical protein